MFHFFFNNKPLVFTNASYGTVSTNREQIDRYKFYLSCFRLLQNQQEVYKQNYSYHLINPSLNHNTIPSANAVLKPKSYAAMFSIVI